MFIFKVVIILQHKKCILLLYSPEAIEAVELVRWGLRSGLVSGVWLWSDNLALQFCHEKKNCQEIHYVVIVAK